VYGRYVDEVLSRKTGAAVHYFHCDDQFNTTVVTNPVGTVAEWYEYGDFGQPIFLRANQTVMAASPILNTRLFNGREYDPETGLYYYRTRYLDPATGRFTTRDTIGIWGDPANLGNGYTYVGNNPWTLTDPTGLGWFSYVMTGWRDMPKGTAPVSTSTMAGAAARSAAQGARGGASIAASTFTLGETDRAGWTNSAQYQGTAYDISRASARVGRNALIGAGVVATGGLLIPASAAPYATAVGSGMALGYGADELGTGLGRISEGDYWGFEDVANGGLGLTAGTWGLSGSCPARPPKGPVEPGQTGTYGELKTQKQTFGETEALDMDHQPSFAAQVAAKEAALGRPLTKAELAQVKATTPAVASPRAVHQGTSPTYGGRNTPARIAEDAAELNSAAARDRAAFEEAMKNR
jgi:filamentous hemagglutinin